MTDLEDPNTKFDEFVFYDDAEEHDDIYDTDHNFVEKWNLLK